MLDRNKTVSEPLAFSAGRKILVSTSYNILSQLGRVYPFPVSTGLLSLESGLHSSLDESYLQQASMAFKANSVPA